MVDYVTSLNLIPITTYNDHTGRKTTITSFEDMFKEQRLTKQSKADDTENAASKAGTTSETSSTEKSESASDAVSGRDKNSEGQGIIFRNPSNGTRVRYVDVSDSAKEDTSVAASKGADTKTTTASSMKTTKYDKYFKKAALKYGVSESLLKAIAKAESNFNAKDVSSAGAMGVMQLMPATAEGLGVKDPYDPEQNIMGGAKCISLKLKEFKGDVKLALAAYNAGSGAVRKYGGVPSYCRTYVNRVLSYKEAYETASAVG